MRKNHEFEKKNCLKYFLSFVPHESSQKDPQQRDTFFFPMRFMYLTEKNQQNHSIIYFMSTNIGKISSNLT